LICNQDGERLRQRGEIDKREEGQAD